MHERPDTELAALIRSLLEKGMDLDGAALTTISQVLGGAEAEELAARLTDPDDAEAWSMRDLVLFPDQPLGLAVEGWLLERKQRDDKAVMPDQDTVAALLAHAGLRLRLPDRTEMWLTLAQDEACLLASRLRLGKSLPGPIHHLLRASTTSGRQELAASLALACKQARLPWTPSQETFILTLLHGCLPGSDQEPDPKPDPNVPKPKTPLRRPLDVIRWALAFLEYSGDDIPTALAKRRETLLRYLDQAEEMERVRQAHNFETRRMLGIVEQHFDPEAIRDELELIELIRRTANAYAPIHQIMRRNLGDVQTVEQAADLLE
ncbi:hypothetical protein [Desulfonatronum lacustre]|uniref:hypothetical protein n=1 Tax=Desulfonatronum lacustre TaxID=66849 RepID=UPI00048C229B|nr:hypothetical protein [Desulfonatronum lacustre]